jgi:hypothetical protein
MEFVEPTQELAQQDSLAALVAGVPEDLAQMYKGGRRGMSRKSSHARGLASNTASRKSLLNRS